MPRNNPFLYAGRKPLRWVFFAKENRAAARISPVFCGKQWRVKVFFPGACPWKNRFEEIRKVKPVIS